MGQNSSNSNSYNLLKKKVVGASPSSQTYSPITEDRARLEEVGSDDEDSRLNNNNYNNNNNNEYDDEDGPFQSGIILEPINRDPTNYQPKPLLSSQDDIKEGDGFKTKFTKTITKTNKLIKQAILDSNQKIEEKVKESNKKIEDTIIGGFESVAGVGIKAVDKVRDQHHKRVERHENQERAIWIQDKKQISKYECLDYMTIYNKAYRNEMYKNFNKLGSSNEWQRWIISTVMGIFIGVIAYLGHIGISNLTFYKFEFVKYLLTLDYWLAFLAFFTCNTVLAIISSLLAVYYEPTAAGSGIPEVKGYLNGTKIPHVLKFKTLWTKLSSMIFAVSSGLQVGAEGPMIHIGAIVGNGFSQAQSKEFGFKIPFLRSFRNDKDKRDFVTMGAGAGVAAAFSAPLGGALFSLEEVSSFWSTALTWRAFFCCLVATFTAKILKDSHLSQHPTMIFDMGTNSTANNYNLLELIPFLVIGVIGGFTGALFTLINVKVVAMRRKYVNKIKSLRVLEVFVIITVSTILQFFLPFMFQCHTIDSLIVHAGNETLSSSSETMEQLNDLLKSFNCPEGSYNPMASIIFAGNEESIQNLLAINSPELNNTNRFGIPALLLFFLFYFLFAAYTAGCGISSGTFVPMIVIGASYGRAIGVIVQHIFGYSTIDPGAYALMGAAAFMAGVSRLTISLSVILIETTNELQYLLPLMVTVMVAKWVADALIHPLFDILIEMKYIPYLEPHASKAMKILMCKHIMAKKPVYLLEKDTLGRILEVLKNTNHNGFPVVNNHDDRCVKGLILRTQLLMVLEGLSDVYIPNTEQVYSHTDYTTKLAWKLPQLSDFSFDPEDYSIQVDFTNIMNLTVLTVNEEFAVSEAFQLFRTMGLRHMPVVNSYNKLKGIITKKDLLEKTCEQRYRELSHMKLDVSKLIHEGDDDNPLSQSTNRLRHTAN
ncbi:chloride channel protein [Heterostelium album PN500]|uniref:Chloride channel protein n=1 Tax=Heterostelium pallidum (strain ATCC 26659 / Pp 5 / PN500) TaxID=670386 RepID=D3BAX3_HETP5|nr:chloride channel protein [Heterostelium album PN500]EFA81710.1 chloride channel protein [Heterostelium album PN500]|eukprot:XP_020433827.1 chloride channel protein [Heterostelium album PN500]